MNATPVWAVRGPADARLLFLGEGLSPDAQGRPDMTLGAPGELFVKILAAMNLTPDQVRIFSFLPPPALENADVFAVWCRPLQAALMETLQAGQVQIICAMGESALKAALGPHADMGRYGNRFNNLASALVMPVLHPARLIQDPSGKRDVWESMKQIMKRMRISHAAG